MAMTYPLNVKNRATPNAPKLIGDDATTSIHAGVEIFKSSSDGLLDMKAAPLQFIKNPGPKCANNTEMTAIALNQFAQINFIISLRKNYMLRRGSGISR